MVAIESVHHKADKPQQDMEIYLRQKLKRDLRRKRHRNHHRTLFKSFLYVVVGRVGVSRGVAKRVAGVSEAGALISREVTGLTRVTNCGIVVGDGEVLNPDVLVLPRDDQSQ